jgi:DNA-directed RNA polymerase specialized sigma24 family protein
MACRDGADLAFSSLYNRHRSGVYAYLYKFLKLPELPEDPTRGIFIKFWDETRGAGCSIKNTRYTP